MTAQASDNQLERHIAALINSIGKVEKARNFSKLYPKTIMEIEEEPSVKEGSSGGTAGKASATTESRKSKQKGKSDFRPVTASANLPQTDVPVNKNPKKRVKKSAKSRKWLWADSNGKIWVRKSVLEAWRRETAGGL